MKKAISILIATFVMGIALPIFAAEGAPELHMNARFWDNTYSGNASPLAATKAENRVSLHAVEITAAQEIDGIGGLLTYRIGDQYSGLQNNGNYPVEAKVYYKDGDYKIAGGLQYVPFGIYTWNNLYNPFLDIPGQAGMIWDQDWGALFTYSPKPVKLDLGYWMGAGTTFNNCATGAPQCRNENAEKNTFTGRIGWDILKNLNVGGSYLAGKDDQDADGLAKSTKKVWALDSTWGIVPNLQLEAEYAGYKFGDERNAAGTAIDSAAYKGNLGLVQLKYDILKVPAPLNKITPVVEYSWNHVRSGFNTKNYQEELWFKLAKNLDIFTQFMQEKTNDPTMPKTDKRGILAVKYTFQ